MKTSTKLIIAGGIIGVVIAGVLITKHFFKVDKDNRLAQMTDDTNIFEFGGIKIELMQLDDKFSERTDYFTGGMAQIIQHECDHLDGIII
ncbi:MAG: peptide deformylase [Lachnospiraceae bacterium]|nr:peptide deformylase [Lachnospiraceae bacterium]